MPSLLTGPLTVAVLRDVSLLGRLRLLALGRVVVSLLALRHVAVYLLGVLFSSVLGRLFLPLPLIFLLIPLRGL